MTEGCPRCGSRMSTNDVTTKLIEYVCPRCHDSEIEWKPDARGRTKPAFDR